MESKGMSVSTIVIGLVVIALIAYGIMSYSSSDSMMKKDSVMIEKDSMMQNDKVMMEGEKIMMEKDGMMKESVMMENKNDTIMMQDKEVMVETGVAVTQAGSYQAYDAAKVTSAAQSGKAVLFFYAPWCPTCRGTDADITKNSTSIPSGVAIFKTDYDSSSDLKKKYGVTTQHTFVQVDANGNMITSWRGSSSLASLVANIK